MKYTLCEQAMWAALDRLDRTDDSTSDATDLAVERSTDDEIYINVYNFGGQQHQRALRGVTGRLVDQLTHGNSSI